MATLNNEEVDALMNAIQDGGVATAAQTAAASVVAYDLTSQDRIIRGQMPTLDAINERAASVFGTGLAGRTRLDVRVSSAPAALMKFADVSVLLAPSTTVAVVSLGAGNGLALIILEGGLADSLMAAALGDRKARPDLRPASARRELTPVERMVLKRLLSILCDAMGAAWTPIIAFLPEVLRFESDPRLCNISPPNDMAILTTFEVSGVFTGRFHVVIPYTAVEGARKLLSSPPRTTGGGSDRFQATLTSELLNVQVEVRAVLGAAQIRLERLLSLTIGDIVMLDTSENEPIPIEVHGHEKLAGHPRVVGGALAVELTQGVQSPPNQSQTKNAA
jgi:flagellar motor switch protein FliM